MKNKIKTLLILIYCIAIVFSLISCDNKTPGLQSQPWSSEEISEISSMKKISSKKEEPSGKGDLWANKRLRVGLVGPGYAGEWSLTLSNNLKEKSEEWDIVLYHYGDPAIIGQIHSIEKFIENEMDIIVLYTYSYYTDYYRKTGWDEELKKAREAGIPVILIDRRICCEDK